MNAAGIAGALGGLPQRGPWHRCPCPAHQSDGATLALRDTRNGVAVKCFRGCSAGKVFAELRRLGLYFASTDAPAANPAYRERLRAEAERRHKRAIAAALDLWSQCRPAPDTLVANYLRSRSLTLPPPATLRKADCLYHRESNARRPAMVGLVEHEERGWCGIHITYLAIDGSCKAAVDPVKRMRGAVGGAAVRLGPAAPVMAVAEGIETALSVQQEARFPTWAALSASGLVTLVLPPVAKLIHIYADNDANGTGEYSARLAADRWVKEGREVTLTLPPRVGWDFNDVLRNRGEQRNVVG
jgi:putative DNA primase/helicase